MKNIKLILSGVLDSVKPSAEEEKEIKEEVGRFISDLNSAFKKTKIKAGAKIGGSFAKNTTIRKDKYDVDIFVVFDKRYESDKISGILEKILKLLRVKSAKLPGSRDYFSVKFGSARNDLISEHPKNEQSHFYGFRAEIVPVIEIKRADEAKNITDVSLLHVKYIESRIKKSKKLGDEIRLSKAFCYANNCYGAESHIKGFSGYCLELLTSYYGSFLNLAKVASRWKDKVILDPAKYYRKKNVMIELNEAKLLSPLILIDPVQKGRNAAAALSKEKFNVFISICKTFLKKPSDKLFRRQIIDEKAIIRNAKKKKLELYIINAVSEKPKEDISGAKLLKLFNMLEEKLKKEGYKFYSEWVFGINQAKMYFSVKKSGKILKAGPFLDMQKHLERFKKSNKNWMIKKNRIYASVYPKPLNEIFDIDRKQLREMDIDRYFFGKI